MNEADNNAEITSNSSSSNTALDQYKRTEALIAQMDAVLAQGAAAMKRHDEFNEKHGIQPGIGQKMLLGPQVSPRDQYIFARLFDELVGMEERVQNFEQKTTIKSPQSVGARAIGSRYRI